MKKFLQNLLQKFFEKLVEHFDKVLKGLGFAGIGGISFLAFKEGFNDAVDRFGFFARFLQIDDIFDSINNAFGSSLQGVLNTDFIGVCSSFGIITAVNQILAAIGWSFIIFIGLMLFKWFINGAMAIITLVSKA